MKQQKHKSAMLLLGLFLLLAGINRGVSAQTYNAGQWVVSDATLHINGNFMNASTGELYLGNHFPAGQQTYTFHLFGDYIGEGGSRVYSSVVSNDNVSGTRGSLVIDGTATKIGDGTTLVLDLFSGWDGSCIDLVEARKGGSDPQTFRMMPTTVSSGHTAILRTREQNENIVWFITEKLILGQATAAQTRCQNDASSFDPLTVQTVSGTHQYQWYRCNADRSGGVSLGAGNGAQTANYTPPTNTAGTSYYYCVVTSGKCSYNTDTTDVSGIIRVNATARIITQPTDRFICGGSSGTPITLTVETDGDAITYQWFKNGVAVPDSDTPTLTTELSAGTIDRYYVRVSGCGLTETSDTVKVGTALDLIVQRVNTTLMINNNAGTNGGYKFAHYTWYNNDELLGAGEHDSNLGGRYYTGGTSLDPNGAYWAELITTDGEYFRTCPYTPTIHAKGANVRAYPSPVKASSSGMVTVEITGIPESELQTATIDIYYSSGVYIGRVNVNGLVQVPVQMPRITGVYVLQFKSASLEQRIKIIVE